MTGGAEVEEGEIVKVESIINSMTPKERINPDILNESRKKRISKGCGRSIKDINELLKRFKMMRNMMKNMGKSGLLGKITGGLSNIPGLGNGGFDMASMMGGSGMQLPSKGTKMVAKNAKQKSKNKRKQAKKSRKKGRN
jgi:signal recognition particle subunit SRP54